MSDTGAYQFIFFQAAQKTELLVSCSSESDAVEAAKIFSEHCDRLELWRGPEQVWNSDHIWGSGRLCEQISNDN